jgi:UDP-N-acetylmuramate--alanine ligase
MADFDKSVAVCGCHGKTTTSSLLAYALSKLNAKPSWLVGAPSFNEYWGGAYEGSSYFVIEADEYAIDPPHDRTPKLLSLHPDYALCLNIDFDHPDVYKNLEATKDTFKAFFHQTNKKVIGCGEDVNTMDVLQSFPKEKYLSYGFDARHDLVLSEIRYEELSSSFRVTYEGHDRGVFTTSLFGEKNVLNAGGVILLLFELGFTSDQVRDAVRYFTGAKRRFEFIANENGIYLFDDYGHHPHELEALTQAARSRFPDKRIILIFQPHTYTRTAQMKYEFAEVLSKADMVLMPPIFGSAREQVQASVSSYDIVTAANKKNIHSVHAFDSNGDTLQFLRKKIKPGDVIFTVGAGDVYKMGDAVIEVMKQVQ